MGSKKKAKKKVSKKPVKKAKAKPKAKPAAKKVSTKSAALPKGAVAISTDTAKAIAEEVDFDGGMETHSFDNDFESQEEDFDDEGLI